MCRVRKGHRAASIRSRNGDSDLRATLRTDRRRQAAPCNDNAGSATRPIRRTRGNDWAIGFAILVPYARYRRMLVAPPPIPVA